MDTERDELGYLIFRICRAQNNLANTIFSEIGLFRGQPPVLFQLGKHKELTQSQLADMLEVTPATLTNILHRMEKTGLINRTRDGPSPALSRSDPSCQAISMTGCSRAWTITCSWRERRW